MVEVSEAGLAAAEVSEAEEAALGLPGSAAGPASPTVAPALAPGAPGASGRRRFRHKDPKSGSCAPRAPAPNSPERGFNGSASPISGGFDGSASPISEARAATRMLYTPVACRSRECMATPQKSPAPPALGQGAAPAGHEGGGGGGGGQGGDAERPEDTLKICRAAAAYVEQFFLCKKKVHCTEKGVDSLNRDGEGLGPADVHVLASFVAEAGCDPSDRVVLPPRPPHPRAAPGPGGRRGCKTLRGQCPLKDLPP